MGSAWQGSTSGGAPTSHPVQGMTPPPRYIPHQELWVIFTISMPEKNPGTTTARRTGGTQPVALPTGALGVLPHLWVPEGLDSDSCSFFSPSCAPRGWCHLPRPYFPIGAPEEAGLACGAACRGATSPGGVGRACVLRHGAWGRRDGGVCHLGLPTPQLLPWHCRGAARKVAAVAVACVCHPLGSLQVGRCPLRGKPGCLAPLSEFTGENGLFRVKCPQWVEL